MVRQTYTKQDAVRATANFKNTLFKKMHFDFKDFIIKNE